MHYGIMTVRRNRYTRGTFAINQLEATTGVRGSVQISTLPDTRILVLGRATFEGATHDASVIISPAQL